jgi:hypothetical protein
MVTTAAVKRDSYVVLVGVVLTEKKIWGLIFCGESIIRRRIKMNVNVIASSNRLIEMCFGILKHYYCCYSQ